MPPAICFVSRWKIDGCGGRQSLCIYRNRTRNSPHLAMLVGKTNQLPSHHP